MKRRAVPLTGQDTARLPTPCNQCLCWELGAACPQPGTSGLVGTDQPVEAAAKKQQWVSQQVQAGHPPGRLLVVDDEVVAYALFGPGEIFARRQPLVPVVSDDALLLATVWVDPVHREQGFGRLLLQAAIKEAIRLELASVQSYGDRRWRQRACALPATWLLHEGFEVHSEHPRTPLFEIETRRTARWAESFEHAVEEVLGTLPRAAPRPAPRPAVNTEGLRTQANKR